MSKAMASCSVAVDQVTPTKRKRNDAHMDTMLSSTLTWQHERNMASITKTLQHSDPKLADHLAGIVGECAI